MRITANQLDIIFLSYDEPNCEANWRHLQSLAPHAQRVHGVKGSDQAHKACAALATTDRLIIVDGDNVIDPEFLNQHWEVDLPDVDQLVLSYTADNSVNGLRYGNGGIKIWPRNVILDMKTHELGTGTESTDFCWTVDYLLMPGCWSRSIINATAAQAWRAGFREGVKMALVDGLWIRAQDGWSDKIATVNLRRLETWLNVGRDVEHGGWAILGARQGLAKIMLDDWDPTGVHDFDLLDGLWDRLEGVMDPLVMARDLGRDLRHHLDIAITAEPLTPQQSRWFKHWALWEPRREARRLRS